MLTMMVTAWQLLLLFFFLMTMIKAMTLMRRRCGKGISFYSTKLQEAWYIHHVVASNATQNAITLMIAATVVK